MNIVMRFKRKMLIFVVRRTYFGEHQKNGEKQIHSHTTLNVGVPFFPKKKLFFFLHIGTESKITRAILYVILST